MEVSLPSQPLQRIMNTPSTRPWLFVIRKSQPSPQSQCESFHLTNSARHHQHAFHMTMKTKIIPRHKPDLSSKASEKALYTPNLSEQNITTTTLTRPDMIMTSKFSDCLRKDSIKLLQPVEQIEEYTFHTPVTKFWLPFKILTFSLKPVRKLSTRVTLSGIRPCRLPGARSRGIWWGGQESDYWKVFELLFEEDHFRKCLLGWILAEPGPIYFQRLLHEASWRGFFTRQLWGNAKSSVFNLFDQLNTASLQEQDRNKATLLWSLNLTYPIILFIFRRYPVEHPRICNVWQWFERFT